MSPNRVPRHLQVLEDSKNEIFIKNKKTSLYKIVKDAVDFNYKYDANLYALAVSIVPPNSLDLKK